MQARVCQNASWKDGGRGERREEHATQLKLKIALSIIRKG